MANKGKNMFDNSKIDKSSLVGSEPTFTYDTTIIEKEGFKLRYELDPKNPVHKQVTDECKKQNIPYKIIKIEDNKEHIWIKTK